MVTEASIDLTKFDAGIRKLEQATERLSGAAAKTENALQKTENASRKAAAAGDQASASFKRLFGAFTAGNIAAGAIQASLMKIKQAAEFALMAPSSHARSFETSMARVSTITRGTAEETDKLGKAILEMTKRIPKTKEELGAGLYTILQSGIEDAADAMKILEISGKAAIGGVTEIDIAAKILTDTINAYGLSADDAGQLADIMFIGAREGTAEFADLAGALGTVNSTASLVGVSVNEVVAATEAMSLAGIDAQSATTSLNRLFLSLIDPSDQVKEAVAGLQKEFKGFEFSADALRKKGLQGFMKELAEVVGDNEQLMVLLTEDVRAFRAASVIAGEGAKNFEKILEATRKETGALDEAFIRNADTVDNLLVLAWNTFIASITEAGQEHLPEIKAAILELTEVLEENEDEIIRTAIALSQHLVGAIQLVVKYAPGIIDALSQVAAMAGAAADAIGKYLTAASGVGEAIGAGAVGAADLLTPDSWGIAVGGMDTAQAVQEAHENGRLYRDVLRDEADALKESAELAQANADMLDRARQRTREIRQIELGEIKVDNKDKILEQLRAGDTLADIQAKEIKRQDDLNSRRKTGGAGAKTPGGKDGGGSSAKEQERDFKDLVSERDKIEKEILKSYEDQAKTRVETLRTERDQLQEKKELVGLTEEEEDRYKKVNSWINRSLTSIERVKDGVKQHNETVKDAVDAWEKVKDQIEDVKEKIADLQLQLAELDKEQAGERADLAVEKYQRIKDILLEIKNIKDSTPNGIDNEKVVSVLRNRDPKNAGQELTEAEKNEYHLSDEMVDAINATIELEKEQKSLGDFIKANVDLSEELKGALNPGDSRFVDTVAQILKDNPKFADSFKYAQQDDFGKLAIDQGKDRAEITDEIAKEEQNKVDLERIEGEKKQIVTDALEARRIFTEENYKALEKSTKDHVDKQIDQFNRLKSAIDALTTANASLSSFESSASQRLLQRRAMGGPIFGPGTGTSDSIPALLSNGEHVITAAEVRAMGGHGAVMAFRAAIRDGVREIPRYATGGPVSHDSSVHKSLHLEQHYHGEATRLGSPALLGWHARRIL